MIAIPMSVTPSFRPWTRDAMISIKTYSRIGFAVPNDSTPTDFDQNLWASTQDRLNANYCLLNIIYLI